VTARPARPALGALELGRYEVEPLDVERVNPAGNCARVYGGRDTVTGDRVALKYHRSRNRYANEVRALSMPTILESGGRVAQMVTHDDERQLIVKEWVGPSVTRLRSTVTVAEACRLTAATLDSALSVVAAIPSLPLPHADDALVRADHSIAICDLCFCGSMGEVASDADRVARQGLMDGLHTLSDLLDAEPHLEVGRTSRADRLAAYRTELPRRYPQLSPIATCEDAVSLVATLRAIADADGTGRQFH
jgi:hypothetical protein